MCTNAVCQHHAGEVEFRVYQQTFGPHDVIFGPEEPVGLLRYGVVVNLAAWQWEIVAVEDGRKRHVAFVSPEYRLAQVLNLAAGWSRSLAAVSH